MKTFKQFLKEFEDIGSAVNFHHNKPSVDAANFIKDKNRKKNLKAQISRSEWGYRKAPNIKVSPKELQKHSIKPLSKQKEHKDYNVHHLTHTDRTGYNSTATLLHHKKDGFVGTLFGSKSKKHPFTISESFITKKHRGKGLGVALYEHAVQHHGAIVSDSMLSTDSQRIYKHFAKKGRVSVYSPDGEWSDRAASHGEKVKVFKDQMKTKSVSPYKLASDDELQLKIHKKKLKRNSTSSTAPQRIYKHYHGTVVSD